MPTTHGKARPVLRDSYTLAAVAMALVAAGGCGVVSGGRYRDTFQKLNNEKLGTTKAPTCTPPAEGMACRVMVPERDVSDLIGLARDVSGLDPRRAGPSAEDGAYFKLLVANSSYVDIARHGPGSILPVLPMVFDISELDPAVNVIQNAKLTLNAVKQNQVGAVKFWVARLRRGVTEGTPDAAGNKASPGAAPVLAEASFGNDPDKIFDGLKYITWKGKPFDGKAYVDYLGEGLLDPKLDEVKVEGDKITFDLVKVFQHAQEEKLGRIVLLFAPDVSGSGREGDPTYMFVATRAAAESLRPTLIIEYPEPPPPPPEPEPKKKRKK